MTPPRAAIDLMRRGYAAAARQEGDFLVREVLAPDLVLHEINLPDYPWGRVLHGAGQALAESQGTIGQWFDTFAPLASEIYGGGDTVVVVGSYQATVRETGQRLDVPFVHRWRFRDGRAAEGHVYTDTHLIHSALQPWPSGGRTNPMETPVNHEQPPVSTRQDNKPEAAVEPTEAHMNPTPWRRVAALVSVGAAIATLMLTAFAGAVASLEPRGVPLAVSGPEAAVTVFTDQLDASQPGAFDVREVADETSARVAIEDREVYGAVLLGMAGPEEVLTASAASIAVAQILGTFATEMGTPTNDIVAAPAEDPRGAILGAGSLPITVAGVAIGTLMSLLVRGRTRKVAGAALGAVLMGGVTVSIMHGWLGGLSGDWLLESGVVAMGVASIASILIGLHSVAGRAGLIAADVVLILVGNPFSGAGSAPELLPEPWSTMGHWLPLGATIDALRGVSGFDGAGVQVPLLVLCGWLAIGLALIVVPMRRSAGAIVAAPEVEAV